MNVDVFREACCAQDDQLGPLEKRYELQDDCSLESFLATVVASRFLQFTSSHAEMSCHMGGEEVARVFSPYVMPLRNVELAVPAESKVASLGNGKVEFVFDRVRRAQTPSRCLVRPSESCARPLAAHRHVQLVLF